MILNVTEITNYISILNTTTNWGNAGFEYYNGTLSPNLTTFSPSNANVSLIVSLIPSFGPKTNTQEFLINLHANSYPYEIEIQSPCTKENIEQDYVFSFSDWLSLKDGNNLTNLHKINIDPSVVTSFGSSNYI